MRAVVIALGIVAAGCASGGLVAPPPSVTGAAADVAVIRPSGFLGCGATVTVTLDGWDTYNLACGDHVIMTVAAGERIIGVKARPHFMSHEVTTMATIAPGRRYYMRIDAPGPVS
jgi:hypothetical protein